MSSKKKPGRNAAASTSHARNKSSRTSSTPKSSARTPRAGSASREQPTTPAVVPSIPSSIPAPNPDLLTTPPATPDALHAWIVTHLNIRVARTPLIDSHAAPFDYLCHTFFEGTVPRAFQPVLRAPRPNSDPNDTAPQTPPLSDSSSYSYSSSKSSSSPSSPPLSSPDCIIWANRGGGKTFLGALATLLDLLFKPKCQVRVLAGSVEQGRRMHEHLRTFLESDALEHIPKRITARRISLPASQSAVEILAASQTSVRGTRVQKLRCDEVDLFDPDVWSAAQLVTRSLPNTPGPWGHTIRGSVEALSTMHRPFGLMWKLVGDPAALQQNPDSPLRAQSAPRTTGTAESRPNSPSSPSLGALSDLGRDASFPPSSLPLTALCDLSGKHSSRPPKPSRTLFRWGLLDVLEHCPPERACNICPLEDECQGRAKLTPISCEGHITIDDAISMKSRVGRDTWDSEMLCLRPSRSGSVYPEFDRALHVCPALVPLTCGSGQVSGVATRTDPLKAAGQWHMLGDQRTIFSHMIAGMDFGFRSESVILLAGVTPRGVVHVLREHCRREEVLDAQIDALDRWRDEQLFRHRNQPGDAPPLDFIGIDPAGNAHDPHTGKTSSQLLSARGYTPRSRQSLIYSGITLVRDRLNPAWAPPRSAWGPSLFRGDAHDPPAHTGPRLLIDPSCTRLIECLTRYHYNQSKPESLEPEKDGFDHACDALRYMILNLDRPRKVESRSYLQGGA